MSKNKREGMALIVVIVAFSVVSVILYMMYAFSMNNITEVKIDNDAKEMYYLAKMGIDIADASLYATHESPGGAKEEKKILNAFKTNHSLRLEDKITRANIPDLDPDIEITIKMEYQDNGKPEDDRIVINSMAKNTTTGETYTLSKHVDYMGTKTEFK